MSDEHASDINERAIGRAIALLNKNRPDDALSILEAMPDSARIQYLIALATARQGDESKALSLVESLLKQYPAYSFGYALLDELQNRLAEQAAQMRAYETTDGFQNIESNSHDKVSDFDLEDIALLNQSELVDYALQLFQSSQIERAQKCLELAASREDPPKDLYYTMAILHFHKEEFQQGLACLELELSHYPENEAAIELGEELKEKLK